MSEATRRLQYRRLNLRADIVRWSMQLHYPLTLSEILQGWAYQAELQWLTRELAHAHRADCRHWTQDVSNQLQRAFEQHDSREVWKCARRLASKRIGPRARFYAAAPSACPSLKEWSDHLAQSGANGG
eukprot:6634020-Heterocapsa_arctica.AAC.1